MAGLLLLQPFTQFADGNGAPYAGGTLSSFLTGTTTPTPTYSNPDLDVSHSNGIVITLDAAGRPSVSGTAVEVFGDPTIAYKFVLKDADGVAIGTADPVPLPTSTASTVPSPSAPGQVIGTRDGYAWAAIDGGLMPAGVVLIYGGSAAPTGFLACDGTSYLRADYSDLYAAIGTTFGSADGSHFNVPDCRGTFPFFKAASGTGNTLGGTFGAIDHVHTGPSHTHTYTDIVNHTHAVNVTDPGHVHGGGAQGGSLKSADDPAGNEVINNYDRNSASAVTGISATTSNPAGGGASGTTAAGGTGNTGTSNPPALVFIAIIKT